MSVVEKEKLEIAVRCKLLIGSFLGQTNCCLCNNPSECRLSEAEKLQLGRLPSVCEARRAAEDEYYRLNYEQTRFDGGGHVL